MPGADRAYEVLVPVGQKLTVVATPGTGFDLGVDLIAGPAATCDPEPRVCLAGSDSGFDGDAETAEYTNTGTTAQTVFVVVDSYSVTESGTFDLAITIAAPPLAPANDQCAGAQVVSPTTLPALSTVVDITNATGTADPAPLCTTNVSRGVWYSFTPTASGNYTIATCAASTATTVADTVLAVFTSTGGCAGTMTQVTGGCNDQSCASQSSVSLALTGGTTYYVVSYKYGTTAPSAGQANVQIQFTQVLAPANDLCAAAPAVTVNSPVSGTTVGAANDYQVDAGCFAATPGNTASLAPGREVVYSFTPTTAGTYSFRARTSTDNVALYLSSTCSTGTAPVEVATCRDATDRNTAYAEEVSCVTLAASTPVLAYVDARSAASGSAFELEVNACTKEVEPNDTPAAAGARACPVTGGIVPAGDKDYFSLGTPATGSRVFAIADGIAGSSSDFDMRITTATDTLQYDDWGIDAQFGNSSPGISGTPLTGVASYIQMSHYSATTQSEPYRLYSVVQPPSASAIAEVEPNEALTGASSGTLNYFSGSLSGTSPSTDIDVYSFNVTAGDLVFISLDGAPLRTAVALNAKLELLSSTGAVLLTANDGNTSVSTTAGTGSLTATSPKTLGEAILWRARTSGVLYVRVTAGSTSTITAAGDYLLSISKNCVAGP